MERFLNGESVRRQCRRLWLRLSFERLENRSLLSASTLAIGVTNVVPLATATVSSTVSPAAAHPGVTNPAVVGNTPSTIRSVYGFSQLTTFTTSTGSEPADGTGQTIAIVDAYNDPNIASDLAVFDRTFGIAAPPHFTVVSQTGSTTRLPTTNAAWDLETALDVQWAHAIAPGANILLVEATSDRWSDLLAAVNYAKNQPGVSVVSMSWGSSEYRVETATDGTFTTAVNHPVTFVTAAGDDGSPASYPATSPDVLSVGGTTLTIAGGNSYGSETTWSDTGGGVSMFEREPAFQDGAQNTGYRSGVDVAYDADPNTGFAVYDTINAGYGTGWIEIGGTSAGTPQWSALLAIANEGLAAAGKPALANAQARLYSLPANAFHDVTTGNNGTYAASPGYDAVTGLGTPVANVLIADLVGGVTGSPTGVSSLTPMASQSSNHFAGSAGATPRGVVETALTGLGIVPPASLPFRNASALSSSIMFMPSVAIEPIAKLIVDADAPQVIRLSGGDLNTDLTSAFSDDNDWLSDRCADGDVSVPSGRESDFDLPQQPTDSFAAQIAQPWEGEAPAEPFLTPSDA
jgi:subtilase family serine protease